MPKDIQKEFFEYAAAAITQDFKDVYDSNLIGKFYASRCSAHPLLEDYGVKIPQHLKNAYIADQRTRTHVILSSQIETETQHISGSNKNGYFVVRFHPYKVINTYYYAVINIHEPIETCLSYTVGLGGTAHTCSYSAAALHKTKNLVVLLSKDCCLDSFSWGVDFTRYIVEKAPSLGQEVLCLLDKMEFVGELDILYFISAFNNGSLLMLYDIESSRQERFRINDKYITQVYQIQKVSLQDIKQLALVAMAWDWLSSKKKWTYQGREILRLFNDKTLVPNKYKLIWRTTTSGHGSLFKRVYENLGF